MRGREWSGLVIPGGSNQTLRIFHLPLPGEVNKNASQGQQGCQEQNGKDGSAGIAAQPLESINTPQADFGVWLIR